MRPPAGNSRSAWLEWLVMAAVVLLVVWGIGSYGIWDPWELGPADAARILSQGGSQAATEVPLSVELIAAAFTTLGIHDWSARLPAALAGLLTCGLLFLLMRAARDRRTAVIAVCVLASTPAFLLNVRLLMGGSLGIAAQSWVGVTALGAAAARGGPARTLGFGLLLAAGVTVSVLASGVLLGPLPPMLAVATWSLLVERRGRLPAVARWLFPAAAAIAIAGVARAVALDAPDPSLWLGGGAVGGQPPTYDKAWELLFHGLAPWSAALPVVAVWTAVPRPNRSETTQHVAWILLLWSAFAWVSWTLFASRYGTPATLGLLPLCGLVAIWMGEIADEPAARWPAAVIVVLLLGLLIRDYALYPESPLRTLPVEDLSIPDVYDPKRWWAVVLGIAAIPFALFLVSHESVPRPDARRWAPWLRSRWQSGWAAKLWLLLAAWLIVICWGFGLVCLLVKLPVASLVIRVGRAAFFVPFVIASLILGASWLRYAYGKLGALGVFPLLGAGLATGAFVVFSFQPALSRHFSPKPVYDAYTALSEGRQEPLAVYRTPASAARQYTRAPVERISDRNELFAFLDGGGPRWVVMEAEQLPALDRAYRRKTGKHLYVADARSARLLLVGAVPLEGRPNASFLERAVRSEAPTVQHPVDATYERGIELIGFDLELPREDSVGAGQHFAVTWYWRALERPPAGYQVFVHIDGQGLRLNGDHQPVDGRYPTKLWDQGDVIVDRQELLVPANFPPGDYPIYVGWFSGDKRLAVRTGPQDGANRVRAGILPVR
ncbi:MAG: glycosyltransferase family 39 protein [Myxococcales bacterium]